jgi:HSP20 family protein
MTSLSLFRPNGAKAYRNDPFALARELFALEKPEFAPAFNVKENENAYLIEADLPGVKDEDVEITFDRNRLTIAGTRNAEAKTEGDNYHLYERRYGSFSRSFTLPQSANADAVEAKLDAGVLTVTVPKKAETKARKIPIK